MDVVLVDGLLFQRNGQLSAGALGIPGKRFGNQFPLAAPSNMYACTDGYIYGGVLLDSHWQALCGVLQRPDLAALRNSDRIAQREALDAMLAQWCATRSRAEVVATLVHLGLTVTPVNTFVEAAADEHIQARDMPVKTCLSDGREVPLTGPEAQSRRGVLSPAAHLADEIARSAGICKPWRWPRSTHAADDGRDRGAARQRCTRCHWCAL